jgi:formiminotetrahydrofolate cyclodeaminase
MTISSGTLAEQSVGRLATAVASDSPTPGGGAVAGLTTALAAALAAMAGRYAATRPPATGRADVAEIVSRADELREQALHLADEDARVYQGYVEATRLPREPDPTARRIALRAALDAAAEVPFALTGVAHDIARTGELLFTSGNPNLRSDARTATYLAAAAAASTAVLVAENLRGQPDDPRVQEAARRAQAAADAAARVGLPYDHLSDRDPNP